MSKFGIILLVCFAIILTLNSCSESAEDLLRAGNNEYKNEKFLDAEALYKKSFELDENYLKAKFNIANSLFMQNKYAEAIEIFEQLANQNSEFPAFISYNIANSFYKYVADSTENPLLQFEYYTKAAKSYKKSLLAEPDFFDAKYNLSYMYELLKKFQNDSSAKEYKNKMDKQEQNQQEQQQNQEQIEQNKQKQDEIEQKQQENKEKSEQLQKENEQLEQEKNNAQDEKSKEDIEQKQKENQQKQNQLEQDNQNLEQEKNNLGQQNQALEQQNQELEQDNQKIENEKREMQEKSRQQSSAESKEKDRNNDEKEKSIEDLEEQLKNEKDENKRKELQNQIDKLKEEMQNQQSDTQNTEQQQEDSESIPANQMLAQPAEHQKYDEEAARRMLRAIIEEEKDVLKDLKKERKQTPRSGRNW